MNLKELERFATWARLKLIDGVIYRAGEIGITETGIATALEESTEDLQIFDIGIGRPVELKDEKIHQRRSLVKAIRSRERGTDYKSAFNAVVEEVAYTWFNRLIAVRFMEINNYLPSRIRILSAEDPKKTEPDIVTTPFDANLDLTEIERKRVVKLKNENRLDDLFCFLFIKQCNQLHNILPELFEETADYSEILLPLSFTDQGGIVWHLVNDLDEAYFDLAKGGQIQVVGWLYQFYNVDLKETIFADLKKNIKITKEKIPAATQLFTPEWIVKYMVENSLGRLWLEGHPDKQLAEKWTYFMPAVKQPTYAAAKLVSIKADAENLRPEEIRVIDPSMGSGHILVCAFDVLMQIYESCGYTKAEAARLILENNLYGLDIDKRAFQLAYFAVMMKAREFSRHILDEGVRPHLYVTEDSRVLSTDVIAVIAEDDQDIMLSLNSLAEDLREATELGSMIHVRSIDFESIYNRIEGLIESESCPELYKDLFRKKVLPLLCQAKVMAQTYHVVVTNPPYMGNRSMGVKVSQFVKTHYPRSKSDLFAVFIEKGNRMTKPNGFNCMVTMQSWMFLKSFAKMRENLLNNQTITALMHMDNMVMGIAFGTAVVVLRNHYIKGYRGTYNHIKWSDIVDGKPFSFPVPGNRLTHVSSDQFAKIPGQPVAYWVSPRLFEIFDQAPSLGDLVATRTGLKTGNNSRFLRFWWEVASERTFFTALNVDEAAASGCTWFPYNKGGARRKWYGNNDYVVNWYNRGEVLIDKAKAEGRSVADYPDEYKFAPCGTWSLVTSGRPTFRMKKYQLSDMAGMSFYKTKDTSDELFFYILGFCNTIIAENILDVISSTVNFQAGDVARLPIIVDDKYLPVVGSKVKECIDLCREDWNAFETSWDFKVHPLIRPTKTIVEAYAEWVDECTYRFNRLKENEEQLNKIFLEIYGLQDQFDWQVDETNVSCRKADLEREIRSFISFAVGCMFGRYSLDGMRRSVAPANSELFFDEGVDGFILTDEPYLADDLVSRFISFVDTVYGKDHLADNLDFIASAIGKKGNTKEVIRSYFLKDFYKDHLQIYQKRPIYWLFESGSYDAIKVFVYMQKWDAELIGRIRVRFLHRVQQIYTSESARMDELINNSLNSRDKNEAEKRKNKLNKQHRECMEYDEKLSQLVHCHTVIDLDDGVKVNHTKVQTTKDGTNLKILANIQ